MMMLSLVSLALWIYELVVVARVVSGWIGADPDGSLVKALKAATEPVFELVRPLVRKIPGPIDWTPGIVILGLEILRRIV